jgi:hypothetical protein
MAGDLTSFSSSSSIFECEDDDEDEYDSIEKKAGSGYFISHDTALTAVT